MLTAPAWLIEDLASEIVNAPLYVTPQIFELHTPQRTLELRQVVMDEAKVSDDATHSDFAE